MNLLDLIFPKRCVGCGRIGKYFCSSCLRTIRHRPQAGTALISFFRYEGVVRKAIKTLKYRRVSDLAEEFVSLILPSELTLLPMNQAAVLVPIPLHPSRRRERGFNQAEVLGRELAAQLHIPVRTDILRRIRPTAPQAEIKNRKERLRNVKNVFSVNTDSLMHCHTNSFILFDDVATTGATIKNAARALRQSGVANVRAVTMAR